MPGTTPDAVTPDVRSMTLPKRKERANDEAPVADYRKLLKLNRLNADVPEQTRPPPPNPDSETWMRFKKLNHLAPNGVHRRVQG